MTLNVPVEAAKNVAKSYKKDQVILICWSEEDNKTWVTTYGATEIDCDQAAQGGNWLKKNFLNWPKSECCAEPERVSKLKSEIESLKKEICILKSNKPMHVHSFADSVPE